MRSLFDYVMHILWPETLESRLLNLVLVLALLTVIAMVYASFWT